MAVRPGNAHTIDSRPLTSSQLLRARRIRGPGAGPTRRCPSVMARAADVSASTRISPPGCAPPTLERRALLGARSRSLRSRRSAVSTWATRPHTRPRPLGTKCLAGERGNVPLMPCPITERDVRLPADLTSALALGQLAAPMHTAVCTAVCTARVHGRARPRAYSPPEHRARRHGRARPSRLGVADGARLRACARAHLAQRSAGARRASTPRLRAQSRPQKSEA